MSKPGVENPLQHLSDIFNESNLKSQAIVKRIIETNTFSFDDYRELSKIQRTYFDRITYIYGEVNKKP